MNDVSVVDCDAHAHTEPELWLMASRGITPDIHDDGGFDNAGHDWTTIPNIVMAIVRLLHMLTGVLMLIMMGPPCGRKCQPLQRNTFTTTTMPGQCMQ